MAKAEVYKLSGKRPSFSYNAALWLFTWILAVLVISISASRFLLFSTELCKADAVILFVGPEFEDRYKQAGELLEKGYAEYLIIPGYHVAARYSRDSDAHASRPETWRLPPDAVNQVTVRPFYEKTHTELLYARAQMDELGLKSAIFVSSPYHMRRICIISKRVFDPAHHRLSFIPTRFEKMNASQWYLNWNDARWVSTEYAKIVWFYFYSAVLS